MSAERALPVPRVDDILRCARLRRGGLHECRCRIIGGWEECPASARGLLPPELIAACVEALGNVEQRRAHSRTEGFTGDMCDHCGNFRMARAGTCAICTVCGASSGCS